MARLFQEARTLKIKQREEEKRPVIPLEASLAESWTSGGRASAPERKRRETRECFNEREKL
jgi:hypothetical protein